MACCSRTMPRRAVPTVLPRNGSATSSVSWSSSPSAGAGHLIAVRAPGSRRPRPRPRCSAIFGAWTDHRQTPLGHSHQRRTVALYYQGSRSVSEVRWISRLFSISLARRPFRPHGRRSPSLAEGVCSRLPAGGVPCRYGRPAHIPPRAIEEGRFYEERVAASLSVLVFGQVFLASAIAAATPKVREATLILLYRLLFILYAEDRDLLPVRNTSYDDYAAREGARRCQASQRP